jgi:hypothetical protein
MVMSKRVVINNFCECQYHIENDDMTRLYVDKICDKHKSFLMGSISVSPEEMFRLDDDELDDWKGLHLAIIDDE